MAFFGLTALGPQNSFASSATTSRNLQIFEDEDFQNAWERVNGKNQHCKYSKLQEMMMALFRGPVPSNDWQKIELAFDRQCSSFEMAGILSFSTYMRVCIDLRTESMHSERQFEGMLKPTCEFNSSRQFQTDMLRHHRMERDIQDKQICALTSSQEYGWEKVKPAPPVAGRSGTDITRFAAELVKNGIYY